MPADRSEHTPLTRFEALYRAHAAYVWAVLRRLGVEAVDDAHQEVFITAYRRRHSFDSTQPVRPWLVGIARRVAFRHRRSRARRSRRLGALAEVTASGADYASAGRVEACDFLARFMEELPPTRRAIFVHGELEGLTGREIAERLGLRSNVVYGHLRAARSKLKAKLLEVEAPPAPRRRLERCLGALIVRLRPPATAWWTSVYGKVGLALVSGAGTAAVAAAIALGTPTPVETKTADAPVEVAASPAASSMPSSPSTKGSPTEDEATEHEQPPRLVIAEVNDAGARSNPRPAPIPRPSSVTAPAPAPDPARRLVAARRALVEGDAPRALALLRALPPIPPGDPLDEVRGALRVEALCAMGKPRQARGEARLLERRHPESNVARHALTVCNTAG